MSYSPIAGAPIQYQKSDGTLASGYYLKFYVAGTTTPLSMGIDATPSSTLAKCQINSSGYPINGSSAAFIPHLNANYKAVLYKNSTDADADTTGNADWVIDNITIPVLTGGTVDSSLITYTPAGTGAVATNVQAKLREYVSVTDFGADQTGVSDSTAAIQAAFDSGVSVYFPDGVYSVSGRLTLSTPNVHIYGPGIIKPTATFSGSGATISIITIAIAASNVTVNGLTIDSDDTVIGSQINFQLESFAPNTMVTNCRFLNSVMIGGASGSCVAFRTTSTYSQAIGNYTENTNGAIFVQGANCAVSGNVCVDPNDVGIVLNGPQCVRCVISNNVINNDSLNSLSGSILVEESASQWVIEGNTIYGINNGIGIGAINVAVFTIVNAGKIIGNIINGGSGTTTNPCALISCNSYYQDIEIANNHLIGCPSGNSASRMLISAASGGSIHDNIIDDTSGAIIASNVEIQAASRGITISNNISRARSGGRHFLFSSGDFGSVSCQFSGGRFLGGSEGINTALSSPTNIDVWLIDIIECTATSPVNMDAGMAWGDRQTFLNVSNVTTMPLSIKARTVMYGTATPTTGSWLQGDTVYNLTPAGTGVPAGWVCSSSGTPGTWRDMANLV